MAEALPSQLVVETTTSALQEKGKLRRHFRRFDMLFFLICTVVTLDTIGAVASNGAQGFTWLLFLAVFFFLPYALSIAELGSAFPQEGGPYMWTRLAFGRPLAAVNSVIYWVSNPIWVGGSLTIVSLAALGAFFTPISGAWQYVFAVVFIWFTIGTAIVSLQYGKWVPTLGAWARGAVLVIFEVSVILYAARHGLHGLGGHAFLPTYVVFIAVVPVLFFNFAGMEVPSAAGEEMTNPRRDVPFSIAWSGLATVLAYGIPVLSIVLVLPTGQVSGLSGFLDAAKAVFTVYGGHVSAGGTATLTGAGLVLGRITAVVFVFALASAGATWIMGADRTEAAASFDGGGPRLLGRFSARFGTPVWMNLLSGVVATVLMVAAFKITGGNADRYFAAVLGLTISTTTVSYLLIFPALIKLRYSRPEVERPYRVPWGTAGAWLCSVVPTFWALLATVALIWPGFGVGWFGTGGNPNDDLASLSFSHQRTAYELSQIVPLAVIILVGVIFYALGGPTRRSVATEPVAPAYSQAGAETAGTAGAAGAADAAT
ncbi:MAG TPA: APC family permease [Streptosporangiaceae bacterium]|nr:APC family permease [Streptosporangiaceae bacterium]